ncbi:hypothetical protein [Rhodopirellula bahusiensis]|uniref:Uncharacterized protein n=1 Tax=Rhodopirellula bahusiensis TaxID=2014065 RepID=A0A2G1WDR6_9BACT|nr:hypothetical protein [Rhodopirellula bahusiensis]PHQ37202.1 hypothetical protein CEE69_02310 [Rhodopirellula bahusiensis]
MHNNEDPFDSTSSQRVNAEPWGAPDSQSTRWPFRILAAILGVLTIRLAVANALPLNWGNFCFALFYSLFGLQMLIASVTGRWWTASDLDSLADRYKTGRL